MPQIHENSSVLEGRLKTSKVESHTGPELVKGACSMPPPTYNMRLLWDLDEIKCGTNKKAGLL